MAFKIEKESVKDSIKENRRSLILKASTEDEIQQLKEEAQEDVRKSSDMFFMSARCDVEKCQEISRIIMKSDEVIEKKVFEFALKNCHKGGSFEEFPDLELKEFDLTTRKAIVKFAYFGSNARKDVQLANRRKEQLKVEYYAGIIGKDTEIEDYYGTK